LFEEWQRGIETAKRDAATRCDVAATTAPSQVAESLAQQIFEQHGVGSTAYWGNDGFCVDVALTHPALPADVTLGLLADFTRYAKTPDPIAWEQFRSVVLASQGWELHRLWTPALFREPQASLETLWTKHEQSAKRLLQGTLDSAQDKTK